MNFTFFSSAHGTFSRIDNILVCSRAWKPQLLSPRALEPVLCNKRSPRSEKPTQYKEEKKPTPSPASSYEAPQGLKLNFSPASSVLAREGAGCGSVGDVPGAWLASAPLWPSLWT